MKKKSVPKKKKEAPRKETPKTYELASRAHSYGDDLESWAHIADGLCRLKMANEYAGQFGQKMGKYISKEDQVEMAGLSSKYDFIYWKYWEKLVKKIRGI